MKEEIWDSCFKKLKLQWETCSILSTLKTDVKHLSDDEVRETESGLLKFIERTENLPKVVQNLLECSNSVQKVKVMK